MATADYPFLTEYRARCLRVVDGDTLDLELDLGFRLTIRQRIRILSIDAPEVHAAAEDVRQRAAAATARLRELVMVDGEWPLLVVTEKPDSFGRWLASVWVRRNGAENLSVGKQLVIEGLAAIRTG